MINLTWSCRTENGIHIAQVRETVYPWRSAHLYISPLQQRTLREEQQHYMILGWATVLVARYQEGKGVLA